MTIGAIRGVERRQVHPLDCANHKPRQMISRQPIPHIRRQQKPLLTTTLDEVLRHTAILLITPDGTIYATASVGNDVAAQLVGDYLARSVKELRKRAREERKLARDTQAPANGASGGDAVDDPTGLAGTGNGTAIDPEAARRAEREAERQAREDATRFNLELGRAVFTSLSRVRVDEPVLKLLASVEIVGELADVAMRGARYGFPGWVTETEQKNGKTRYCYLEKPEAAKRAHDYLRGATKPGEIAGRQLALLAMATYADQSAVAASSRSWHTVKASGPWGTEADEALDKLVADNLPDGALTLLAPVLDKRKAEQEERFESRKAREEAASRLEGIEERVGKLTVGELEQAERDLDAVWSRWTPEHTRLRDVLAPRRAELAASDKPADDTEPVSAEQ